ncbi:unnamed protein product [Cylindrotheca closterium]|uniref:Uncharacterized protein n=1 Tax=Cylindrotheca closterium TaxID=2856 RepID=A0AAD2JK74_9STRA|nr:unnamed protein product [Cylindrotheca closterium]
MSIIGHLNSSSEGGNATEEEKKPSPDKISQTANGISIKDFFDLSKPWVLVPDGSFSGFFNFIPATYRQGPWSPVATIAIIVIISFLSGGILSFLNGDFLQYFQEDQHGHEYVAFTQEWYMALLCFSWTAFLCWHILNYSAVGAGAWVTFTVWSWTCIVVRSGLAVMAPFVPGARLPMDMLRFPTMLSASLTFFLWNFVLFPIILVFIKDPEKKKKFIGYMTNFRLTQLHVCNIFIASYVTIYVGPRRQLHTGDAVAAATMVVIYVLVYYLILDRIGVHLYPIFSPRTPAVVISYALFFAMCHGGFQGWQKVLEVCYKEPIQ